MYFLIETTKGAIEADKLKQAKQQYLDMCQKYGEYILIDYIAGFVGDEREKSLNFLIDSFEEDAQEYISFEQHPDEVAKESLSR